MNENRKGDWFQTFTGKQFWALDPRPEDINILDIAHALANTCRYGGHCKKFYSVAQHSVFVSQHCPFEREGLMHDATEAYMGDMVRPLKYSMPLFIEAEEHLWTVIAKHFNLAEKLPSEVKVADNLILMTERRDIVRDSGHRWAESLEAISPIPSERLTVVPWSPKKAEQKFLERFYQLFPSHKTE